VGQASVGGPGRAADDFLQEAFSGLFVVAAGRGQFRVAEHGAGPNGLVFLEQPTDLAEKLGGLGVAIGLYEEFDRLEEGLWRTGGVVEVAAILADGGDGLALFGQGPRLAVVGGHGVGRFQAEQRVADGMGRRV